MLTALRFARVGEIGTESAHVFELLKKKNLFGGTGPRIGADMAWGEITCSGTPLCCVKPKLACILSPWPFACATRHRRETPDTGGGVQQRRGQAVRRQPLTEDVHDPRGVAVEDGVVGVEAGGRGEMRGGWAEGSGGVNLEKRNGHSGVEAPACHTLEYPTWALENNTSRVNSSESTTKAKKAKKRKSKRCNTHIRNKNGVLPGALLSSFLL